MPSFSDPCFSALTLLVGQQEGHPACEKCAATISKFLGTGLIWNNCRKIGLLMLVVVIVVYIQDFVYYCATAYDNCPVILFTRCGDIFVTVAVADLRNIFRYSPTSAVQLKIKEFIVLRFTDSNSCFAETGKDARRNGFGVWYWQPYSGRIWYNEKTSMTLVILV